MKEDDAYDLVLRCYRCAELDQVDSFVAAGRLIARVARDASLGGDSTRNCLLLILALFLARSGTEHLGGVDTSRLSPADQAGVAEQRAAIAPGESCRKGAGASA